MSPASSKDWALSTHAWESVNASKHTHKESFIRISLSLSHTHTHTLTHSLMHEHWRRRVSRLPTQTNRPAVITHEQVFSFFFFSCLSFEILTCRYPSRFPLYQVKEYRVFRISAFHRILTLYRVNWTNELVNARVCCWLNKWACQCEGTKWACECEGTRWACEC